MGTHLAGTSEPTAQRTANQEEREAQRVVLQELQEGAKGDSTLHDTRRKAPPAEIQEAERLIKRKTVLDKLVSSDINQVMVVTDALVQWRSSGFGFGMRQRVV